MKARPVKAVSQIHYRIAGYLHGMQFLWMSLIYHELVIFTDVLFMTRHFNNINI